MWKYICKHYGKGVHIMTTLILSFKKTLLSTSSPISIFPCTDYHRHVPKSVEQQTKNNWCKTGDSLYSAIKKVGDEIEK